MRGLSTILSWIIRLLYKMLRKFGINSILILFLVMEVIGCLGYVVEAGTYDSDRREFDFVSAELTEIAPDDPVLGQHGYQPYDRDVYYLVRVSIKNRYSEPLSYLSLDAVNEHGHDLSCQSVNYYESELDGYGMKECIPAGAEGELLYVLSMSDSIYEESSQVTLSEFGENGETFITADIPKQ